MQMSDFENSSDTVKWPSVIEPGVLTRLAALIAYSRLHNL